MSKKQTTKKEQPVEVKGSTVSRQEYDELERKFNDLRDKVDQMDRALGQLTVWENNLANQFNNHVHGAGGLVALPVAFLQQQQQGPQPRQQ